LDHSPLAQHLDAQLGMQVCLLLKNRSFSNTEKENFLIVEQGVLLKSIENDMELEILRKSSIEDDIELEDLIKLTTSLRAN
jgi:hypothetical protein